MFPRRFTPLFFAVFVTSTATVSLFRMLVGAGELAVGNRRR
jgi:hypothetical protein